MMRDEKDYHPKGFLDRTLVFLGRTSPTGEDRSAVSVIATKMNTYAGR